MSTAPEGVRGNDAKKEKRANTNASVTEGTSGRAETRKDNTNKQSPAFSHILFSLTRGMVFLHVRVYPVVHGLQDQRNCRDFAVSF